jgi:anti-sigma B factor antagonist
VDDDRRTRVNIEKRMAGDVMVLTVGSDKMDGPGATIVGDKIRSEMVQGQNRFILDLGNVRYVDSAGLGSLIHAFASVRNRGGVLKLLNLHKRVEDLLVMTRLLTVFEAYESEESALASFEAAKASGA